MTTAAVLVAYASVVGALGGRLTLPDSWASRNPRLAIFYWQALTASVVASVLMAGLALSFPVVPGAGALADLLHTCVMLLRSRYSTPSGALAGSLGIVLLAGVVLRVGWCLATTVREVTRRRAEQRDFVTLHSEHDPGLAVDIVAHDRCAVYCVPGRRARIIVTSAAAETLDREQMAAVLAHERAHLSGRHHLVVMSIEVLRRAFPFVPVFRHGADAVARLVEMVADDRAARGAGRVVLATALVRLASASTPAGAMAAGGATAIARVQRLIDESPNRYGRPHSTLAISVAILLVVLPVVVAAAPALGIISSTYCPLSFHS